MKHKITAVHLYNDHSGSPKVLAGNLRTLVNEGYDVHIYSSDQKGPLSNLEGTTYHAFSYAPASNKYRQLFRFLQIQVLLFVRLIKELRSDEVLYVNTLLPFGAALAGKLKGCKVIYHLHETSVRPAILKGFLKQVANWTATQLVYVSDFLAQAEPIKPTKSIIIPNSLTEAFIHEALQMEQLEPEAEVFTCLMACSLRKYKGVDQFVELARRIPGVQFELVLNASEEEVSTYFEQANLPENLVVFPRQHNMHWFYRRVHLVLNLSLPDQWVETFGMTLLEGMCYGRPAIGPTVGGPAEIIVDQQNGFKTDAYDIGLITEQINYLANDIQAYRSFSYQARRQANQYNPLTTGTYWLDLLKQLNADESSTASTLSMKTV